MQILNIPAIYTQLLTTNEPSAREAIYREQLIEPFSAMIRVFGITDLMDAAKMWTLFPPEAFASEREHIQTLLTKVTTAQGWERFAQALTLGQQKLAPLSGQGEIDPLVAALLLTEEQPHNPLDRGYNGFGGIPGYLLVTLSKADAYTLPRIEAATVHELNHNYRFRLFPFDMMRTSVAEYIVVEGLAESFAAELYGPEVVGFFANEISDEDLALSKGLIAGALQVTGFQEVRQYIFGDVPFSLPGYPETPKRGIPPFAGYAIGFRVVQQFIQRTGKTVAEATFLPAQQIIEESGYFQD